MAALEEFSRQIEARLAVARREPRWQAAETAQFMAELEPRRRQFEEIAPRLVKAIIRPRLQAVASYFPNAAPDKKVNPEVAREAADSIGQYITKAQKHFAWMRKQAQASNDKETLTALDGIDKNLADAAKSHAEMQETCLKDNVDAAASMECCKVIDDSLAKAIADHDKLMKKLAGGKAAAPKK